MLPAVPRARPCSATVADGRSADRAVRLPQMARAERPPTSARGRRQDEVKGESRLRSSKTVTRCGQRAWSLPEAEEPSPSLPVAGSPAAPSVAPAALEKPRIAAKWREDASWGRNIGRYIGDGFLPAALQTKLQGLELIEQLFVLQRQMAGQIRYEKGKVTIKREAGKRGLNKPVTYASNIWDRGYANCAGHCIVCASAMKALGVPYCVVTLRSKLKGKPKHAIMQVGFSEDTDIRKISRRASELWAEFYGDTVQVNAYHRQVRLYNGLKFVRSRSGSEAAKRKGLGHWLILDPVAKVGCYHHLVKNGYMTQTRKNFGFAAKPQIKSWQRADDNALSDSDSDDSDVKVDDQALDDAEDILDLCT